MRASLNNNLRKKIDVYFIEKLLPTVCTCGLSVTLPLNDIENAMKITLHYAGGFFIFKRT